MATPEQLAKQRALKRAWSERIAADPVRAEARRLRKRASDVRYRARLKEKAAAAKAAE